MPSICLVYGLGVASGGLRRLASISAFCFQIYQTQHPKWNQPRKGARDAARHSRIAQAVAHYQADLERVSFKGSVDALRQYSDAIAKARNLKMRRQLWTDLLLNLARDLVP